AGILRYLNHRPRTDGSANRRAIFLIRAWTSLVYPADPPLRWCALAAADRRRAPAIETMVRGSDQEKNRPERQVRSARARQLRRRAGRRCSRHTVAILRARVAAVARYGQSRLA